MNQRPNLYAMIHKALRAAMGETLSALGRMDPQDDADTTRVLGDVRALLVLMCSHLEHENAFIHPALEARRPGASGHTAQELFRAPSCDGAASVLGRSFLVLLLGRLGLSLLLSGTVLRGR